MAAGFITRSSKRALLVGSLLWLIVFVLLFLVMNAPQCPEGYTQEQVEASKCIVGANIGVGLLVVGAPMLWAVCVYVSAAFPSTRSDRTREK